MPPKRRFASRSSNLVPERPSKKLRLSSPPMSPASSKISPKNLKLKRSRVSPSPSVKSEQSQTERIEDTIICAPIEWAPIIEDEDELDVEEEEQLTQRSIPFDEVFQNESVKRIITQFPKGHGSWYILRCEEHDVDFKTHPLRAASAHLRSRQHGRLQDTTGPAVIEHFGTKVLNCNEELAQKNNAAALKFKPAIKQEETQHVDEFVPAQFAPRESVSKEPTPEAVPEVSVPEQPLPEEPASEAEPEAVPETISEAVPEVSVPEESAPEESTQQESTTELVLKESASHHKKRKLSSTPCNVEDEVSPAKDEPMEESSHDPIISPTPGIVYLAYRESTKTWLPALILPRNNLHKVGVSTTLESLGLVENVPKCYVYDPGTKCLEWKAQYEDGGSLVAQRQFPVVYFDATGFPSKDAAGWVGTGDLQELDLSDTSACLEPHFSMARDFVTKRLGKTGDCKSLSPLAIPDTEANSEMQSSTRATPTKIESPVLMISDNLPAKAPVVVSVIPEKEATPPVETPTTEPSREVSVESDSKPSVTTESFSELADPKPIGSPELVHKPELISNPEPINNAKPVASTDPIDDSRPTDSRPTDSEPIEISEQISEPEPVSNFEPIGSSELISKSNTEAPNSPKPTSNPEPISIIEHTASPVLTNEPEPVGSFQPISRPEVVSKPERINRPEPTSASRPVNSPELANIPHREVSIENQPSRPSESRSFHTEDVAMENQYTYSPASTYVDPVPTPPASEIQSHQHSVKRALLNHMSADLFQLKAKSTTLIFPKAVFDLETLQSTLPPIQSLPSMHGYSQTLRPISDQMGSPVPSISQTQSFPSQSTPSSAYNSPAPQHTPVPQHTPAPQHMPAPVAQAPITTIKKKTGPRKPVPTHRPVPSQRPVPTVPTHRASATPKPAAAQRAAITKKPAAPRRPVPTQRPLAPHRPAAVEEAEPRFGETLYGVSEYILQGVRRWLRTTEKNPKISEFCFSDGLYRCPWCHKRFARAGIFTDHLSLKHDERPKPPEIRPDHR
ncbi:C2H2-type domain-containing protein [Fusarium keratoplasticum]|uniref:C2H2-type domain-containing protein n=1 Tax=Fusarium keratoplasticum TaxID=1328300 RepID=A0ACC0QEB5_9HYPO|nr:C2H2-type domain-containing protein [Fusarium keratoplasticum]KAI8652329.1 C2H2-type domain-containing protein [Fusarium keratoplasticum]KAI8653069.1 C2H2-type domain-containing protein [Fusarium keratoplasticum]